MIETPYFPLGGGLNLIDPAVVVPVGHAIAGVNYEPAERGYRRIDGYERRDGQPKPSEASYWLLGFDQGSAAISEDDIVTGATSGATGKALFDAVVETGGYGGGDAAGYLVLTVVSGTFQDDEDLQVSAATKCVADGTATQRGASTDSNDSTWLQDAIETARALIGEVPGSGQVRGAWLLNGSLYAFRDNAGGTAGVMHKETSSGWAAQDLGRWIDFDTGTASFTEGDTLTGGTSGATATIERIVLQDGTWSGGDADGYLVLSSVTGTFQNNETITDGAGGSALADGADSAITLPAGGRYEFVTENFYGSSYTDRMYGCNGVGNAFEWDGSVFVPIRTGMATDTPHLIAAHKKHLFLAFDGGSLQHSSLGEPVEWQVVTGAAELGIGSDLTALVAPVSGALVIFARNKVAILYGNDVSDWSIDELTDDAGAQAWTAQNIGLPIYMDNRGLRTLATTQRYGNFNIGTLTRQIEPLMRAKRAAGTLATASLRVRSRDQYRLFFDDGTGITVYLGHSQPEIMPFNLGITVRAAWSCPCAISGEQVFLVADDGYVYQADAGTNFDGEEVDAYLRLPFNHVGSPTRNKAWKKAVLDIDAGQNASLGMLMEFSYADPDQPAVDEMSFSVSGGGGFWDEAAWDEFYWSSPVEGRAEAYVDGIGVNASLTIVSRATYEPPHTLHGVTLHFEYRGVKR